MPKKKRVHAELGIIYVITPTISTTCCSTQSRLNSTIGPRAKQRTGPIPTQPLTEI